MKRIRLTAALALIAGLSLACADFQEGFEQGTTQALQDGFAEATTKLQAMPASRGQKRLLKVSARGSELSAAGEIELVDGSVFLGELDAAISDGEVTDEEADQLVGKFETLTGESMGGPPGGRR